MNSFRRFAILGAVGVGVLVSAAPADAQSKEARGTVTAVSSSTISVKSGNQDMTFVVDSDTHLEVRSAARNVQQAQPGNPSPRVNDFFELGQAVLIRYRESGGRNHALDISRVGSPGSAGGSTSDSAKIVEGKVTSISQSALTIEGDGGKSTFGITQETRVVMKGATMARKTASGPSTPITTFVHTGDVVTVTFADAGGTKTASEVRVKVSNK